MVRRWIFALALFISLIFTTSAAFALCGDVSDDGSILSNDVLMVARASIGTFTLTAGQLARADVTVSGTPDGQILSNDLLMVARASIGTLTSLNCSEGSGTPLVNEWITIPAGDFVMGCATADSLCNPNESPKHTVTLSTYKIQKYEVTNAQYAECVAATTCTAPEDLNSEIYTPYYGNETYNNYPVIWVDWNKATTYCGWIGGRLPTEAEWEKAARGPDPNEPIYPWGNTAPTCALAEFYGGCTGDTAAVGSHPTGASYYGAMDMAGNVYEWVNDWYDSTYYTTGGPPWIDPQGPASGTYRVLRSTSWSENAGTVRNSRRNEYSFPDIGNLYLGFRCAQN